MLILAALNAYHYIVLKSFKDYDNEEEISQMRHDNDFQPLEQDPETQEARSGIQWDIARYLLYLLRFHLYFFS